MNPRRLARLLTALLLCLSLLEPARGAGTTRGLLVLPQNDASETLSARVRGQTIDLAVDLQVASTPPEPLPEVDADDAAILRWARPLAAAHGVQVVIWLSRHRGGLRVTLCDVSSGLITHKHTAPDPRGGAVARSATQEEAALLVRSLLRSYPAPPEAAAPPPQPPPAPPPQPPRAPRLSLFGAAGWQLSADGASPLQQGPSALLGLVLQRDRWSLPMGVLFLGGLPAALRDPFTEVTLHRQVLALSLSYQRLVGPGRRWQLSVGLAAGVALYGRSTLALTNEYTPTPARLLATMLVGPGCAAAWRAAGPWWLALDLAADGLLFAPALTYETTAGSAPVLRNQLWPVQPRLQLALRWQPLPR